MNTQLSSDEIFEAWKNEFLQYLNQPLHSKNQWQYSHINHKFYTQGNRGKSFKVPACLSALLSFVFDVFTPRFRVSLHSSFIFFCQKEIFIW